MANDITVKLKADAGPLKRGMAEGSKSVQDFQDDAQRMAINVAKAGAAVVTAVAAIAAGVLKMASEAAAAGVEIKNLAAQASIGTTDFQKMAAATRTVGFEQEKLSDILKDVNDKFGDYMATGAGPLADFFENIAPKIGVTAEQFANLSGPDALQLYVSSLEKANVSQQEMTFYMEALASDATRLLPLLRNNGSEMNRLGDEAQRTGRILSEEMIAGAIELDREMTELTSTLRTEATRAIIEHKDEIILLVNFLTDTLIPAVSGFIKILGDAAEGWRIIGRAAADAANTMRQAITLTGEFGGFDPISQGQPTSEGQAGLMDYLSGTNVSPGGATDGTPNLGRGGLGEFLNDIGGATPAPSLEYGGRGGAGGPSADEIIQAQAEAHLAAYELRQEQLGEIESLEQDHGARLVDIREQTDADLAKIERAAMQARLQSVSGAFGDLSSLMASENDKLFKIGKAAAIAEATVSGISSAISAWEKGMSIGGPPLAAAFAGASIVKTGALISQLSSASQGGGARPSIGGGSTPTAQQPGAASGGGGAADQAQRASVNLTLIGEQGFTRAQVVQVAEALNEAGGDGTRLVDIRGRR